MQSTENNKDEAHEAGKIEIPQSRPYIANSENQGDQELNEAEGFSFTDLAKLSTKDKSDNLLGDRFLTKEGSWLIVAQSGVGKSVLAMQMAINFALGRDLWGLKPIRPLKIALIQAENNKLDLAEPLQSMLKLYNIDNKEKSLLDSNLIFYSNSTEAGAKFPSFIDKICNKNKPNIIILDPLLSYIGGDISRQDVCSKFLRNDLHPILKKHQIGIIFMHHTSKPKGDDIPSRILSYAGAGSADLTNYCRAVSTLFENKDNKSVFDFNFSKRGKRFDDIRVAPIIYLKHADDKNIHWERTEEPPRTEKKKVGRKYDGLGIENLPTMTKEEMDNKVYDLLVEAGIETKGSRDKDLRAFWNNNHKYNNEGKGWLIYFKKEDLWEGKFYAENKDHLLQE